MTLLPAAVSEPIKPRVRTEARFALGSRHGRKSTIWKVSVHGDETYITCRMFGSDSKVSIHASGQAQWSRTSNWVRRQSQARNADRHIVRWICELPSATKAALVFRVEIPATEQRALTAPIDKKKVFWVANMPDGATVRFLFYLTPPLDADPADSGRLPYRHLFSLRQRGGRWLVACVDLIALAETDLSAARVELRRMLAASGIEPTSEHRSCLFAQAASDAPAGLIELCPIETS